MRNWVAFIFRFYINASIHVALAVYALLYVFVITHNIVYDESLMYTVFFGTITGYNFVKYAPVAKLHHRSLAKSLKLIQVFSLISFGALLYYFLQLPFRTIMLFLIGTLLVMAYAIPFVKQKNLRSIAKLKIYLVAFCWTLSITIAPIVHFKIPFSWGLFLEVFQIFILVIALIIPFDIRDLIYDKGMLETFPQNLGIKKSKLLAVILLFVYALIDVVTLEVYWKSSVVIFLITSFMVLKMPKKQIRYYCSFGIESVPILKLVLILIAAITCF